MNEVSFHAEQERLEENLDITEIEHALAHAEILEQYPEDPRGESCLCLGYVGAKPIHVVVGWAHRSHSKVMRVITIYIPQAPKWKDPRKRGDRPSVHSQTARIVAARYGRQKSITITVVKDT